MTAKEKLKAFFEAKKRRDALKLSEAILDGKTDEEREADILDAEREIRATFGNVGAIVY